MISRNIAVIGGTGFIGEYLIKFLSENPENSITAFFHITKPRARIKNVKYSPISDLDEILDQSDCLVMLTQPNKELINHVLGTSSKLKRIVYASTLLLYPDSEKLQSENSDIDPLNEYEKDKALEENILQKYFSNTQTKLTIARIANVYGDIKNGGIIQKIFNAISRSDDFIVNNDGLQIRDYIFIEDVATYLKFLIERDQENKLEIFNICSSLGSSINNLINEIEIITNKRLARKQGPKVLEKNSVMGNNTKITKFTKIQPKYNLQTGLKKTYQNFLKENR